MVYSTTWQLSIWIYNTAGRQFQKYFETTFPNNYLWLTVWSSAKPLPMIRNFVFCNSVVHTMSVSLGPSFFCWLVLFFVAQRLFTANSLNKEWQSVRRSNQKVWTYHQRLCSLTSARQTWHHPLTSMTPHMFYRVFSRRSSELFSFALLLALCLSVFSFVDWTV